MMQVLARFRESRITVARLVVAVILAVLIVAGICFVTGTPEGRRIVTDPYGVGQPVRDWIGQRWILAAALFLLIYILLTALCLPMWWYQVLAGYVFGAVAGVALVEAGGALGAVATWTLARWLSADWLLRRYEAHLVKFRKIDERLGRHGLAVVTAVRLAQLLPYGPSYYIMGFTRIRLRDVTLGTLIGNLPAAFIYVAVGADPRLLADWRYISVMLGSTLILSIPLIRSYFRSTPSA